MKSSEDKAKQIMAYSFIGQQLVVSKEVLAKLIIEAIDSSHLKVVEVEEKNECVV